VIHIFATPSYATPWWATHERLDIEANYKVFAQCCARRVPADETVCSINFGGYHAITEKYSLAHEPWDRDREDGLWFASYYDSTVKIKCGKGCGCEQYPRYLRGAFARANSWMRSENW
jgi:hypothetical protein